MTTIGANLPAPIAFLRPMPLRDPISCLFFNKFAAMLGIGDPEFRPERVPRIPSPLVSVLSGALVYSGAAALGLWLMAFADGVPAFWPANGLLVALILTLGCRQAPWVLAGGVIAILLIQTATGAGVMGLTIGLSDLLEVLLLSYAAHRLRITNSGLESVSSVVALIGIIAVGSSVSSLGAALALHSVRGEPLIDTLFMVWRLNAISALIILAPYFAIVRPGRAAELRDALQHRIDTRRTIEIVAILLVFIAGIVVMQRTGVSMIAFFTAPLLWCAIRFGPATTALAGSVLSLAIILLVVGGYWPSVDAIPSKAWQLQRIEMSLSFNTLPPLLVAAAIANMQSASQALKLSQERLRYALAGSGEGVWDWNIQTDETYFSDSWYRILGYQRGDLPTTAAAWEQLRHPDDEAENRRRVKDHLQDKTPRYSIEQRFRHKEGHWVWVLDKGSVVERDADGRPLRAVGTLLDISRRRERLDELNRRAHHDPLTGLANRVSLEESFAAWSQSKDDFCFVLIDLDAFKPINDRFGHQFGDHALVAIADRIRACLGPDDIAARIGGDEFALLVSLSASDAEQIAGLLVERISEPIGFADAVVATGASIGIATVTKGQSDFQSIYRDADIALYDAKAAGGSTFRRSGADRMEDGEADPPQGSGLDLGGREPADASTQDGQKTADQRHG
jgi:diguanylate cyclase (GGDEF)-like protein/PAS domain S-box-containing protein